MRKITGHQTPHDKIHDKFEEQLYFDFYGELLTDRLKLVLAYYYNDDYSASEIAEITGMTRQGAYDALKRGKKQLRNYESKLGLVSRFEEGRQLLVNIADDMASLMDCDSVKEDPALRQNLLDLAKQITRFAEEF